VQTSNAFDLSVGTTLTGSVGGAASVAADSLNLKATGTAILQAIGPLILKGSTISFN
jgi:hypothetical protein